MIYFICIIHLHIFHGNIWTQNWPAPNVSGFIAQLVERRTGIARSRVQAPLKSWIFFRLLYAIVKIAIITARIILHLISYPQFTYDFFHMHHSKPSWFIAEMYRLFKALHGSNKLKYIEQIFDKNRIIKNDALPLSYQVFFTPFIILQKTK